MKPTKSDIVEALRPVQDPVLHRSIVDLDMVRNIRTDEATVALDLAVPAPEYPGHHELGRLVGAAIEALDGIDDVGVDFLVMSDDDVAALQQALGHVSGADGQIRPNPFQTGDATARVLVVASGKGGVGKSTIAANLAVALAKDGTRVGVLDADIYGFSVPRMVGVDAPPLVIGDMIVPPETHGVSTISMGFFADDDQPIIWRGPMIHKAMEQFLVDVYWGGIEYLILDMPPGTGDVQISLSQFLPDSEVVVVTTPQPAAARVAQRAGRMAEKVDHDIIGVVENMSWLELPGGERRTIFGEGGGETLAADLGVPLLAQVPVDEEMRVGADEGRPIVAADPDNPAARAIVDIAERIKATPRKKIRRPELKITPT